MYIQEKGVIHAFQTPFIVQEHWEEKNVRDKLLMRDPINSSSPWYVNNQRSDYNRCTNLPFVYKSTLPKYHELIKDKDVEDNYDPNIPKGVDANCPRMFVYDDAQVNILEEALPFQMDHKSRIIEKRKKESIT